MILLQLLLAGLACADSLQVDLSSPDSIKAAAKLVAADLISYYPGDQPGQTLGILPGPPPAGPYYWWESGAMWGTYIDYWHYTGDTTYNSQIQEALLWQAGAPANSYMPPNWTASLGNDDQGFWGMSALLAAEVNFQNPPADQPQWLALAQAVFNTQADPSRHDSTCGGGLRWQIPWQNTGYDYKNSIANGIFFNMGARLARYTNNASYANYAIDTWNWENGVGFMSPQFDVYDGSHIETNCTPVAEQQFSYNAAVWLEGAAFMYNYTNGSSLWLDRVKGLVTRTQQVFFSEGAAIEVSCELPDQILCKTDMLSYKGYLHRWMATTASICPPVHDTIMATLKNSTSWAVKACTSAGKCGFRWNTGTYDGNPGAGQSMSVLAALSSLLVDQPGQKSIVTNNTGGTSVGNAGAGNGAVVLYDFTPLTTGDKAGAIMLTVVVIASVVTATAWMLTEFTEHRNGAAARRLARIQKSKLVSSMPVED